MYDLLEKLLMLILLYGAVSLISVKGASGDIVRFTCVIGTLVFLTGKVNMFCTDVLMPFVNTDIIEESSKKGKEIFEMELNSKIEEYIENDIREICHKYGADGEVEVDIGVKDEKAQIEEIIISADFDSIQGIGFIKNEIMKIYNVDEVKIIEN